MRQARQYLPFRTEADQHLGRYAKPGTQYLDGHLLAKLIVYAVRAIDAAHPAVTDDSGNFIGPYPVTL
jgi:hypothetical protein